MLLLLRRSLWCGPQCAHAGPLDCEFTIPSIPGFRTAFAHPSIRLSLGTEMKLYGSWIYLTLALIPLVNIVRALLPLFRPKDDLSDIPLTPAQRKLLGLAPSSGAATP